MAIESERHRNSSVQVRGLPGCWKIPARPSSLLSARRVASGVASSAKSPLGDSRPSRSTAFPPSFHSSYSSLRKNSGLHSVKRQPIRVYGQWDQTPNLTPPHPSAPFLTHPPVSACLHAYVNVIATELHFVSHLRPRRCLAAFSARMLVRSSDVWFLGITARKTIICPTRAAQFQFSTPCS